MSSSACILRPYPLHQQSLMTRKQHLCQRQRFPCCQAWRLSGSLPCPRARRHTPPLRIRSWVTPCHWQRLARVRPEPLLAHHMCGSCPHRRWSSHQWTSTGFTARAGPLPCVLRALCQPAPFLHQSFDGRVAFEGWRLR
jgi:hypothetical protein